MFRKSTESTKQLRIDEHQKLLEYSRKLVANAEKGDYGTWVEDGIEFQNTNEIASNIKKAVHMMKAQNEAVEMRLKMLNQAMNVGLWESEIVAGDALDNNNIIAFSNEFRQMLGFHNAKDYPDSFASWAKSIYPDDRPQLVQEIMKHVNDPGATNAYNVISRMITKSGEIRWFRCLGQVVRNQAGVPVKLLGIMFDIHEEKVSPMSWKHSSPDMIWLTAPWWRHRGI